MSAMSRWRARAREVIDASMSATIGKPDSERIAAIDAAYPFGPREHHPYKMWLIERRRAIASMSSRPIDVTCPACGVGPRRKCRPIERTVSAEQLQLMPDELPNGEMHAARLHAHAAIMEARRG